MNSQMKLYDVTTVWNMQTQDFFMVVRTVLSKQNTLDVLCVILYTLSQNSAQHIWDLKFQIKFCSFGQSLAV